MQNKINKITAVFACFCLLLFLFPGCTATGNSMRYPDARGTPQGYSLGGGNMPGSPNAPNWGSITGRNQSTRQIMPQPVGFDWQRAENIKRQLGNFGGIHQINTVVNGNTALVGYRPTAGSGNQNAVRNDIVNRVKQIDGSIIHVMVTESADLSTKIGQLSNDIRKGRPISETTSRFNELIRSMNPSIR